VASNCIKSHSDLKCLGKNVIGCPSQERQESGEIGVRNFLKIGLHVSQEHKILKIGTRRYSQFDVTGVPGTPVN
jgi:hypothetical protein